MRKARLVIITILIGAFLCGCNEAIEENAVLRKQDYSPEAAVLNIDRADAQIRCLIDDRIIYSRYEDDGANLAIYEYDLKTDQTYQVGAIEDPYISSGSICGSDGKLYMYYNKAPEDGSEAGGIIKSTLYQIDTEKHALKKITDDFTYQTLIYVDLSGETVFSFKGQIDGEKGITYIDAIDPETGEQREFKILLSKECSRTEKSGESIYHFSVDEEKIYLIVYRHLEAPALTIQRYTLDGQYVDAYDLPDEMIDILNGERISEFEVIGDYAFLRNFSGGGGVFHIKSGKILSDLLREYDLDIAVPIDQENAAEVLFYSRETGDIWRFRTDDFTLHKVEGQYDSLKSIFIDGGSVLLSSEITVYGQIDAVLPVDARS